MLKKDFIVRQFEEFGKVMAVILGYKKQNDWANFEKEIFEATQKYTSLEINYVEDLSHVDFEIEVLHNEKLSLDQKKILSDLLFEKLHLYLEHSNASGYINLKHKCIALYRFISGNLTQNEFNLDVYYKLDFLNKI
jgi:hypothetical protein